jgi:hypothetical protein
MAVIARRDALAASSPSAQHGGSVFLQLLTAATHDRHSPHRLTDPLRLHPRMQSGRLAHRIAGALGLREVQTTSLLVPLAGWPGCRRLKLQPPCLALHLMPTERLPAIGNDGAAYIVVKKTPAFAPMRNPAAVMATYQLSTGEALTPTTKPHTFRLLEGRLEVTLVT